MSVTITLLATCTHLWEPRSVLLTTHLAVPNRHQPRCLLHGQRSSRVCRLGRKQRRLLQYFSRYPAWFVPAFSFPISLHSVSSSSLNSLKLFLLYPNFCIPFFIKSPVLYRGFRAVFIILLASPGFPPLQAPPLASPSLARRVKPKPLARIACAAL